MWNDLNMTQRNELIKLYLNNGISSLDKMKEHYNSFAKGGSLDKPDDERPYIPNSEQNYGYLKPVEVTADRPEYMYGLTDYDWARANSPYYRNNLGARARFIRDVGTKNLTGQSDYMRDVNKLSYIPNAAVGAIGAIPAIAGLTASASTPAGLAFIQDEIISSFLDSVANVCSVGLTGNSLEENLINIGVNPKIAPFITPSIFFGANYKPIFNHVRNRIFSKVGAKI